MDRQIHPRPQACLRAQASAGDLCLLFHLEDPCEACAPHVPDFRQQVGELAVTRVLVTPAPEER